MGYLLDTNIVSASLKQNVKVNTKLQEISSLKIVQKIEELGHQ